MPTRERDRPKLKLEFFKHKIDDVSLFFKGVYGSWNGLMKKNTVGRAKEKQLRKESIMQEALEKARQKAINEYEIPIETLLGIKKTSINLLVKRLNDFIPKKDKNGKIIEGERVDVKEVVDIYKVGKIELKEPINITKDDSESKESVTIVINNPKSVKKVEKKAEKDI